jgi:FkbM family methyltransferase
MIENLEKIQIDDRVWFKITGDTAFESILEGFEAYAQVWKELVPTKGVVVQAGGYCGVFPRLLSEMFNTVYTFEPDALNFFCLTLNCQHSDNIIKAQGAMGNDHGLLNVVRTNASNRGMNIVTASPEAQIPTYRIDDLGLKSCDLIALDTEGYEFNILTGALKTIDAYKPVITVEDPTEKIDLFLDTRGYKLRTIVHNRDAIYSV